MQVTDLFIIFTILIQPLIIAVMGLCMLKDKGADIGMFVIVGSGHDRAVVAASLHLRQQHQRRALDRHAREPGGCPHPLRD